MNDPVLGVGAAMGILCKQDAKSDIANDNSRQPDHECNGLSGIAIQTPLVEAMYAKVFEISAAATGITRFDNGLIIDVNQSWQDLFQYSHEEAVGRSGIDLRLWSKSEERARFMADLREKGNFRNREFTLLKKSGESLTALCSAELMTLAGEKYIVSTWLDISDRTRAEQLLKQSEQNYREIFENATDAIFIHDAETGTILDVNQSMLQMYRIDREAIKGLDYNNFCLGVSPYSDTEARQWMNKTLTEGPQVFEWQARRMDGTLFWVEVSLKSAEINGQGRVLALVRDISDRKTAEEELRKSEWLLSESQRSAHIGSWSRDLRTERIQWSDETYRIYGLSPGVFDPAGEHIINMTHPEDQLRMQEFIGACLAGKHPQDIEFRIIHPDRTIRTLMGSGSLKCAPDGTPLRLIGTIQDITERKRAENAFSRSQKNLIEAQRQTHIGSFNFDFQTECLEWSEEMFRICGVLQRNFRGSVKDFLERVHPDDLMQVEMIHKEGLKHDGPLDLSFRIIRPNGDVRFIRMMFETIFKENGSPLRRMGTFQDVTEIKKVEDEKTKLEGQLRQAQRMESIGRLAGGVAHDFNNMLGVILGHTELALEQVDAPQPLHFDLKEIQKAAIRSADLTKQLLAFARKQAFAPRVMDLNETVLGMARMLQRLIGENIKIEWKPEKDLSPIKMDPSQIDQILANLVVNARDAIEGSGTLTIETANATLDEMYCATHAGCVPGNFVLLAVSDTGAGMDENTLAHIFEPFFTTKEIGKGTGLGLATVYGIVKQNNGYIDVASQPGQGTRFEIYLPAAFGSPAEVSMIQSEIIQGDLETILLVEDEPAMLKLVTKMLKQHGYTVLPASTPGEAIQLARKHLGMIHILMTDVVMPEMNGRDLAKNLLSLFPHLKCLFVSGYSADIIAQQGKLAPGTYFLQKPFSIKGLGGILKKIKEMA
jgi:two-component system, cell cycle sensor histidine kinase and response regulator CckA